MSELTIIPVKSRREQKQFLMLPWRLYRDDPCWVPPLRANQKELVGYTRHPFYEFNEAQTFLALRDGQPCGRVAAIINKAHIDRYKDRRGFFGFFESENDNAVANGLFDAARKWFEERDIVDMRGPANPSLNYECGLLVDGFDGMPTFMMTYNPPYYAQLLEQYGFRKVQDMYAFRGHEDMLEKLDKKLEFIFEETKRRFNLNIRTLDVSRFKEDVRVFLHIYNEALAGTWGYTPLSEKEIDHLSKSLRHLIVPELTCCIETEGKPVAATFALLDYNPRIREIDGKLFPFGFIKLLTGRRKIHKLRLLSTNVLPAYQRWGLGLALMGGMLPNALEYGIEEGEFSWVLESNHLSYSSLKRGGAEIHRTYRMYDYGPNEDPTLRR